MLQRLKAAALVHERAVHWSYVIGGVTRINACACRKIEWRVARKAANSIASRRAAVDVLLIAQLVVVVGGIIALSCEKRLQTILATGVHWQKLFAIFPREIVEQLRLGRSWD